MRNPSSTCLWMFAVLLTSCAVRHTPAGEVKDADFHRQPRPRFSSKSSRGARTRLVLDNIDIGNGSFSAACVSRKEVMYRVDFSWSTPPETLKSDGQMVMVATVSLRDLDAGLHSNLAPRVEIILDPMSAFTVKGFPVETTPWTFDVRDLAPDLSITDLSEPLSQKLTATLGEIRGSSLKCGYSVTMPWNNDTHKVKIVYGYSRRRVLKWCRMSGHADAANADETGNGPLDKPWRNPGLQRFFARYIADLNIAIRDKRGPEWAVDEWGRELGPPTSAPLRPAGNWENPRHYLWERNAPYDFHPVTIRTYLPEKTSGDR